MPTDTYDDQAAHAASDDGMPHPKNLEAANHVEGAAERHPELHLDPELQRRRISEAQAALKAGTVETPLRTFLRDVESEVSRARAKFPAPDNVLVALMEEVGELAKASLDEHPYHIYLEAMQVACIAARVALEGDPTLSAYRARSRSDGTQAKGQRPPGGPHNGPRVAP